MQQIPFPVIHVLARFFLLLSFFFFFYFFFFLLVLDISTTGSKATIVQNVCMIVMTVDFIEPFTLVNSLPSTTTTWQQCELATLE